MEQFFDSTLFTFVVLPLLILIARVCDVTLGTLRIMFVARGHKILSPLLGFFEILIWLIAIRQIMQNLGNISCFLAYAGGFAIGNYIGIIIEERLAYGKSMIRIITKTDAAALIEALRCRGFGVTKIDAQGGSGLVNVIYSIIDRIDVQKVIETINRHNPRAFFTIEDVRSVKEGIFPSGNRKLKRFLPRPPKLYRRGRYFWRKTFQRKSK
jgi:uncharacterized protein YebE (UPF0316 family)